jgi:hypothetical protein
MKQVLSRGSVTLQGGKFGRVIPSGFYEEN